MAIETLFGLRSRGHIKGDLKLAAYRLPEGLLDDLKVVADAYRISQAKLIAIALDEFIYLARKNAPASTKETLNQVNRKKIKR